MKAASDYEKNGADDIGFKQDIWSAGVVLLNLLLGNAQHRALFNTAAPPPLGRTHPLTQDEIDEFIDSSEISEGGKRVLHGMLIFDANADDEFVLEMVKSRWCRAIT